MLDVLKASSIINGAKHYLQLEIIPLIHLPLDKMAAILQMTFWNAFL